MNSREPTRKELAGWLRRARTIQKRADDLFHDTMSLGVEHGLTDMTESVRETVENLIHTLEFMHVNAPKGPNNEQ